MIRFAKARFLFQDGFPAQPRLVDLHDQPAEQLIIIVDREAVMIIMVIFMNGPAWLGHRGNSSTVGHRSKFFRAIKGKFFSVDIC